jgi:hypothetical protein
MRRAPVWLLALLSAGCVQSATSFPEEPGKSQGPAPAATEAAPQTAEPPPQPLEKATPQDPAATSSRAKASAPRAASAPPDGPAPLTSPGSPFVELPVPNHRPAVVSLPLGATSRRPVDVNAIVYNVYVSSRSGGQSFGAPSLTSSPGAASVLVQNLVAGSTYYVVARAKDPSGREDGNTRELSIRLPSR